MDVPQWILPDLLWRKLSATLSLRGWHCPFSAAADWIWETQSKYVDSQRLQRAGSCLIWAVSGLRGIFGFSSSGQTWFLFLKRKTDSFSADLSANTLPDCQSPAFSDTKSAEKSTACQNSRSASQECEGRRWEEIPETITSGHVSDRDLRYLVTQLFSMQRTYSRDTWTEQLSYAVTPSWTPHRFISRWIHSLILPRWK